MVYKSCCFYPTEYKKVYQFLDNMKQEGYIVKSIDFKKEKAEFIKSSSEYVYGIDYSILYTRNRCFFDEDNERFDIAKLSGWKLQCFTDGIGIWVHDDVKESTPFFLDEEYKQIEQKDYDNNLKLYKKWLGIITFLFVLTLLIFIFDNHSKSFYHQSVFLIYIIVISIWKIKHEQLLSDQILKVLSINYVVAFCFSYFPFYLSMFFELITFLVSIDIIRDESFMLKKIQYLNIYKIVIIIITLYSTLVYKI